MGQRSSRQRAQRTPRGGARKQAVLCQCRATGWARCPGGLTGRGDWPTKVSLIHSWHHVKLGDVADVRAAPHWSVRAMQKGKRLDDARLDVNEQLWQEVNAPPVPEGHGDAFTFNLRTQPSNTRRGGGQAVVFRKPPAAQDAACPIYPRTRQRDAQWPREGPWACYVANPIRRAAVILPR